MLKIVVYILLSTGLPYSVQAHLTQVNVMYRGTLLILAQRLVVADLTKDFKLITLTFANSVISFVAN